MVDLCDASVWVVVRGGVDAQSRIEAVAQVADLGVAEPYRRRRFAAGEMPGSHHEAFAIVHRVEELVRSLSGDGCLRCHRGVRRGRMALRGRIDGLLEVQRRVNVVESVDEDLGKVLCGHRAICGVQDNFEETGIGRPVRERGVPRFAGPLRDDYLHRGHSVDQVAVRREGRRRRGPTETPVAIAEVDEPALGVVAQDVLDAGRPMSTNDQRTKDPKGDDQHDNTGGGPAKTVVIQVNTRDVTMPDRTATGAEVKAAAIAQGVAIQPTFVLSVKHGNRYDVIGDNDEIKLHKGLDFIATDTDDNS